MSEMEFVELFLQASDDIRNQIAQILTENQPHPESEE